jgi:MFS family permease
MLKEPTKKYLRLLTYLSTFFLTVHIAFPSYFNAQFLGQYLKDDQIGIIYAISSLLTILFITNVPKLIRKIGILKTISLITFLDLLAIIPIAFVENRLVILILFVIYYSLGFVVRYALDVYLEKISDDRNTGDIRGVFLTFTNIAFLVSPFLAGSLITDQGFPVIFIISALTLLPVIYLSLFQLKEEKTHRLIPNHRVLTALKKLWGNKNLAIRNIRNILCVDFLLNLFYAIMVVYTALYLEQRIGLNKESIGIIFTAMLLPFVLFELPLGKLADKYLGEREILVVGFIIIGLATITVSFTNTATIWLWAFILFMTRTGASMIEIMKETYLFKKITEDDTDILSISRNMQPISYIIGPLLVSIFIAFFDLKYIFLVLGLIMFLGLKYSLAIRDTR